MKPFIVVLVIFAVVYASYWYLISSPQRRKSKKHTQGLQEVAREISFLPLENDGAFKEEREFPKHDKSLLSMGGKYSNVLQGPSRLGKT